MRQGSAQVQKTPTANTDAATKAYVDTQLASPLTHPTPIVAETTTARTLSASDLGKLIECSNAGLTSITMFSPTAGQAGLTVSLRALGVGGLTFITGTTIGGQDSATYYIKQYDTVMLGWDGSAWGFRHPLNPVHGYHDDVQGQLQTATAGGTAYAFKALRGTGIVLPHLARNDVFCMTFQMPHRRKLGSALDSVHLHIIPIASANGNISFNWTWGWYANGDVLPNTLPNSGTTPFTLATTDQYKNVIVPLITNLVAPVTDAHSSLLFVSVTRNTTGDTWNAGDLALVYMDAHFIVDRYGSYTEYAG